TVCVRERVPCPDSEPNIEARPERIVRAHEMDGANGAADPTGVSVSAVRVHATRASVSSAAPCVRTAPGKRWAPAIHTDHPADASGCSSRAHHRSATSNTTRWHATSAAPADSSTANTAANMTAAVAVTTTSLRERWRGYAEE